VADKETRRTGLKRGKTGLRKEGRPIRKRASRREEGGQIISGKWEGGGRGKEEGSWR